MPEPRTPRRYADAETALILRRAAELQGTAPDPVAAPTLAELEQVAVEAGIEPRFVRQAAAELTAPPHGGVMGPASTLWLERVVPGEISASAFDELIEEIRSATGMAGQGTMTGRGFTWRSGVPGHPAPPRPITITVTPVNGQTVIRADESMAPVASAWLGTGVASALIGSFGAVSAAGGDPSVGVVAAAVAWAGTSLLGARWMHGRAAARHRHDLADLLERIAEQCEGLIAQERQPAPPPIARSST